MPATRDRRLIKFVTLWRKSLTIARPDLHSHDKILPGFPERMPSLFVRRLRARQLPNRKHLSGMFLYVPFLPGSVGMWVGEQRVAREVGKCGVVVGQREKRDGVTDTCRLPGRDP